MPKDLIQEVVLEELLSDSAAQKIDQAMGTIESVQQGLYTLAVSEDSEKLNLLKVGTVFQIFFVDTLASGKKPTELKSEDWKNIALKVHHYAVLEDEQRYSEFVFKLYADYIDISAGVLSGKASQKSVDAIKEVADTIRHNTELLHKNEITEVAYIDACLWLSLEAMIKLLSTCLTMFAGEQLEQLAVAVSQLAFEYGRYVMYKKEQEILEKYIRNQHELDEQLRKEYEAFLKEVQENADRFNSLIEKAFSPDLHESLMESAALAREAGVKEEEILTTIEDIDSFFMD